MSGARSARSKRKRRSDSSNRDQDEDKVEEEEESSQQLHQDNDETSAPAPGGVDFRALHQEMQIVQYAKTASGQRRRKVPRNQSRARTRQRKLLEQKDVQERAIYRDEQEDVVAVNVGGMAAVTAGPGEEPKKTTAGQQQHVPFRLRGSKAAQEDTVIQGSLVFGYPTRAAAKTATSLAPNQGLDEEAEGVDDYDDNKDEEAVEEEEEDDDEAGVEDDDEEDEDGEDEEGDNTHVDADEEEEDAVEEAEDNEDTVDQGRDEGRSRRRRSSRASRSRGGSSNYHRPRKKKRLFRMRNFRSFKMAERHGDALGAHARGRPKEAIEKLQQVARDAPSAPQVYSSLGMVYEDMLRALQRKSKAEGDAATKDDSKRKELEVYENMEAIPDRILIEQLDLAKKAYGSYHISAILCKKDFVLWVRAADLASEIAELHTAIMARYPGLGESFRQQLLSEKQRWLGEAKNDYQAADNLKPPGIDVPAKLASVLIDLGQLSEALTLLTELKNRTPASGQGRSEFESSYKAWLLYSDLMLRIGHECNQWNQGIQLNSNYMFRRWLRKFSYSFNWQERRLQSLVMALEAAAGTKSCGRLVEWMKSRIVTMREEENAQPTLQDSEIALDDQEDSATAAGATAARESGETRKADEMFEKEKNLLLAKNRIELEAFDKTTDEMELQPEQTAGKQRDRVRNDLLQKQEKALAELTDEFHQDQSKKTNAMVSDERNGGKQEDFLDLVKPPLPLYGSIKAVCEIASNLMRHMLDMKLYHGTRLVGESVSLYFKERAALQDRRERARRRFEYVQNQLASVFAMSEVQHGAMGDGGVDSGDESDIILSDDDQFTDADQSKTFLESLRRGALPPELSVLFSLGLIGEGGRDFVAMKCIQAIDLLEQEPASWLYEAAVATDVAGDPDWPAFRSSKIDPLGRTAAHAYVSHTLQMSGKERRYAVRLAPIFSRHVEILSKEGLSDMALSTQSDRLQIAEEKRELIFKVLTAAARYELERAESVRKEHQGEASNIIEASIETLWTILRNTWDIGTDGVITDSCVDVVESTARAFQVLLASQNFGGDAFHIVNKMMVPIGLLCNVSLDSHVDTTIGQTQELVDIPLSDAWLSPENKDLSVRAFNLCVATNVTFFSGWEVKEFHLDLIRRVTTRCHIGITTADGQVSGVLSRENEDELAEQWNILRDKMSVAPMFDFRAQMASTRGSTRYKDARERHDRAIRDQSVSLYGEEQGLTILLCFSRACLSCACKTKSGRRRLLLNSLSIILPISQFCLNMQLWESSIGKVTEIRHRRDCWWPVSIEAKVEGLPPSRQPGYVRPSKRAAKLKTQSLQAEVVNQRWFSGEDDSSPLSNIVVIPCAELLALWQNAPPAPGTVVPPVQEPTEPMARLNECVQLMRACYTEQAVEKAALNTAVALLNVAALPTCHNPFVCIQQAALFASKASKLGTNDTGFKVPLPEKTKVTAIEALLILGRAECLHSINFYPEAAFLCSYVASVCSYRRRRKSELWNSRWQVISVCAYNVSVSIRHTASYLQRDLERKDDIFWELEVVDELRRGKSEAIAWRNQLGRSKNAALKPAPPQLTVFYENDNAIDETAASSNLPVANESTKYPADAVNTTVAADSRQDCDGPQGDMLTSDISLKEVEDTARTPDDNDHFGVDVVAV